MKDYWNARYGDVAYGYGTEPNTFFKEQIEGIKPGKILLPMEGERRNAAYAASLGWDVTAFDKNEVNQKEVVDTTKIKNIHIRYFVNGFEEVKFKSNSFDALALIYAHVPHHKRTPWFEKMIQLLKPGALIIFEGFSIDQLRFSSGAPRSNELLFTEETILDIFQSLRNIKVWKEELRLNNSERVAEKTSVIRMVGQK